MRSLLALAVALALAAPAAAAERPIGTGASQVWVLRPDGPIRSVVVFVHGWGAVSPAGNAWVAHLRAGGNAVVYPRYQLGAGDSMPGTIPHLRAGLRRAFRLPALRGKPVVAVGYSWGATIAMHYASLARRWRVPAPAAVASVFPASLVYGGPPADARLPASVDVLLFGGDRNDPSGVDAAWRWLRDHPAARKRYVVVRSRPGWPATHDAALRTDATARETFWRPLDRLVAEARRQPRPAR